MTVTYTCDVCGASPLNQPNRIQARHDNPVGVDEIDKSGPLTYTMHLCDDCEEGAITP